LHERGDPTTVELIEMVFAM